MKRILYIMALLTGMVLFTACKGSTWKYEITVSYRYTNNPDEIHNISWVETMSPSSVVKSLELEAYSGVRNQGQELVTLLIWKFDINNDGTERRHSIERIKVQCPGLKVEHINTSVKFLSKT